MRRFVLLALLVSCPLASNACLNDRDSDALAVQNNRFPDAMRVISGRFERNPPRFYRMRVARVEAELRSKPRDFGLYDDLAVAHDKLGDDEMALKIMTQKRALLPVYDAHDKTNKEAWYRFFANDGTFRAHRFLHDGAKASNIGEMKRARDEIQQAIQIKTNAHFGREKYQLAVMDWIVAAKTKKIEAETSLGDFLSERFQFDQGYDVPRGPLPQNRRDAAQGLMGLIVLGAAWQSPDVFDALATSLETRPTVALSYLARHRSQELLHGGAHSLQPKSIYDDLFEYQFRDGREHGLNDKNAATLDAFYPKLRADADDWNASRAKWMNAKFALGQHPDTDANFWNGWKEAAPPSLDVAWFNDRQNTKRLINNSSRWLMFVVFGVPTLLIGGLLWFLRRRAKAQPSAV